MSSEVSSPTDSASETLSNEPGNALSDSPRRAQWIEVGVVFALGVLPFLVSAMFSVFLFGPSVHTLFAYQSLGLIVTNLQVAVPLLYLLWITRAPWAQFGFVRPRVVTDLPLALFVVLGSYVVFDMMLMAIRNLSGDSTLLALPLGAPPQNALAWLLLPIAACTNGFAEELVMRGYLLTRLERLLGGTARSVIVTSLLFALYHLYQGPAGALFGLIFGFATALAFVAVRRIWPVVFAHIAADILPALPLGWV